jgi:hypothetical protein
MKWLDDLRFAMYREKLKMVASKSWIGYPLLVFEQFELPTIYKKRGLKAAYNATEMQIGFLGSRFENAFRRYADAICIERGWEIPFQNEVGEVFPHLNYVVEGEEI